MMNRALKFILFVFMLLAAICSKVMAAEDGGTTEVLIERPVMEYKSSRFRDPFKTYLIKEEPKPQPQQQESLEIVKPQFDFNKVSVQGIIWGVSNPQAIINDKVFTIGDSIEGAQILSIDKKGITLSFYGEVFDLAAPGRGAMRKEVK